MLVAVRVDAVTFAAWWERDVVQRARSGVVAAVRLALGPVLPAASWASTAYW